MLFRQFYVFIVLWISFFNVFSQNLIHVNQLGYYTNSPKVAMVSEMDADSYTLRVASTNQVAYSGALATSALWNLSGENVQFADFSNFKSPGKYYLQIGSERSYPFYIGGDSALFDTLSIMTMKAFYLWRSSCIIEPQFSKFRGVNYARELGHLDSIVYIHRSVANDKRHAESEVIGSRGWYDSSDYGKYLVNGAYAVSFLGMAYELYPSYFKSLGLNLPESGNGVPDLLNELKWEIDWMFNMYDETEGGVYFKLSTLSFPKIVMPSKDNADRYMIGKSTSSALDFASTMAMAARLYAPYEDIFPGYSEKALELAEKAYNWAIKNPSKTFENPNDVSTGEYYDNEFSDEFFLANVQLFITTQKKIYYNNLKLVQSYDSPSWSNVNSIGLMELAIHLNELPDYVNKSQISVKTKGLYDNIYKLYYYSAGKLPLKRFENGSNGTVATNGAILGLAYKLTGNHKYLEAAHASFDYLLGRNSLDYCFVTDFGSRSPKRIHDRRSQADEIVQPLPGYLVGGPNLEQTTDCGQSSYPSRVYPARCYLDEFCSYSTNEISINWNAPLVMLVSEIVNSKN